MFSSVYLPIVDVARLLDVLQYAQDLPEVSLLNKKRIALEEVFRHIKHKLVCVRLLNELINIVSGICMHFCEIKRNKSILSYRCQ